MDAINYLESLEGPTISPTEAAKALGGKAYSYNLAAKEGRLTLPHMWRGRNLRIFKEPLIAILKGGHL